MPQSFARTVLIIVLTALFIAGIIWLANGQFRPLITN